MKTKLLCVDDEPNVLEGLSRILRKQCDVITATNGPQALEILKSDPSVEVVMSDMRMPVMNGAQFLREARAIRPDTVRLLLTGQSDLDSAVSAVNDGQIFRFLSKPCTPADLAAAIEAAATQHRLIHAERVLLEQTLHGSVKTLTDVLSITSPLAFGRATRVKTIVTRLIETMGMQERWQVELAAMLSQLGFITLPQETLEHFVYGEPLTKPEEEMVARVPHVTEQLIGNIPRLDGVRAILDNATKSAKVDALSDANKQHLALCGQVVRLAIEYDTLESQGHPVPTIVATLKQREIEGVLMNAFIALYGNAVGGDQIREVPLLGLRPGMCLAADIRTTQGALVVARGYEVTAGFIERARNFTPGTVKEPVRVVVRSASPAAASAA